MPENEKPSWVTLFKSHAATITVVLSLITLIISTIKSFSSDTYIGSFSLLIVGSLLLIAYNIWIFQKRNSLEPVISKKWIRQAIHVISIFILIFFWSLTSILVSDKYAGYFYYKLGNYKRASIRLKSYTATSNDDIDAQLKLAQCYRELFDRSAEILTLEQLVENIEKVKNLDPAERNSLLGKIHFDISSAYISEELYRPDRAVHHIKKALTYDPNNLLYLLMEGFTKAAHEKDLSNIEEQVRASFREAKKFIDFKPESENKNMMLHQYHYWYGRALYNLNKYDEAEYNFKKALDIIKGQILRDETFYRLGLIEFSRSGGDHSGAIKYWEKVNNPNLVGKALAASGVSLYKQGVEAKDSKQAKQLFVDSEKKLAMAVRMGAKSPGLHMTLGLINFDRGDFRQAAAHFEKETDISPQSGLDSKTYHMLGRSKFVLKELPAAREALKKAIILDPHESDLFTADSHQILGEIALEMGDLENAQFEFEKSIQLGNNNINCRVSLIQTLVNLAEKKDKYSAEQISLYEKALNKVRKCAEVAENEEQKEMCNKLESIFLNTLAYAYAQRKENLQLAKSYIDSALEKDPNEPHSLDTKAWILILIAEQTPSESSSELDFNKAEELLNLALSQLPEDEAKAKAETLYHFGYLKKLKGQNEQARKLFLQALEYDPEYFDAKAQLQ